MKKYSRLSSAAVVICALKVNTGAGDSYYDTLKKVQTFLSERNTELYSLSHMPHV